jgi:hypothetical protein
LRGGLALAVLALVGLAVLTLRERGESNARGERHGTLAVPRASTELAASERVEDVEIQPKPVPAGAPAPLASNARDSEPTPALRAAFAREAPDATAPSAEARLRAIYRAERDANIILRDVRCTRSVCKLELRWSPELNEPYNNALNGALQELSRDIDLTPDITLGGPEMPIPMTLYIARPGHSVASLVAEQRAASAVTR